MDQAPEPRRATGTVCGVKTTVAEADTRASYAAVVALPGAARAFLPVLAGRFAFSMVTLSVLLMVQNVTGAFALAGATTGAMGATNVLATPLRARLVDRHGQRRVMPLLALLYAGGLVGVVVAVLAGAPGWVVVAVAALAGLFPPPLGAAMRVIWGTITPPGPLRLRAFSLDSVSEDLCFTVGPLLVSVVIVLAHPAVAVVVAAVGIVVSTWLLTRSPLSRAQGPRQAVPTPRTSPEQVRPRGLLSSRSFVAMLVVLLGLGGVLGAAEVATAAFAADHGTAGAGAETLSGVLLAVFAVGSCVGGLVYGARDWRSRAAVRLAVLAGVVVAVAGALGAVGVPWLYGVLIALAGGALGPALITGFLVADQVATADTRTESAAWVATAVNGGASLATIVVGVVVDAAGAGPAIWCGAGLALLCLLLGVAPLLRGTGEQRVRQTRRSRR